MPKYFRARTHQQASSENTFLERPGTITQLLIQFDIVLMLARLRVFVFRIFHHVEQRQRLQISIYQRWEIAYEPGVHVSVGKRSGLDRIGSLLLKRKLRS